MDRHFGKRSSPANEMKCTSHLWRPDAQCCQYLTVYYGHDCGRDASFTFAPCAWRDAGTARLDSESPL